MKKCKVCGKKVPKSYIESHQRYHERGDVTNERCDDRKKAAQIKKAEYLKTLRKIEL